MTRIVIVSGIQLSTNPRVVKEADALSDAGYDVSVVGATLDPTLSERDRALCEGKKWKYVQVVNAASRETGDRLQWTWTRIERRFWRECGVRLGISDYRQLGYAAPALLRWCLDHPASLYILHNPVSLWIGKELHTRGHRVAADVEDWYSEDLLPEDRAGQPTALLRDLERVVLKQAAFAVTTSHALSTALSSEYGVRQPAVVYNSFPMADRNLIDGKSLDRRDLRLPSVIWFSQVIGKGRGLEGLMESLTHIRTPFELHLRGNSDDRYIASLRAMAPLEWRERIFIHEQVPHVELLSRVAEHDIGFAGELPYCRSRELTITNKILLYVLAALPVLASDTAGHREVAGHAPEGVFLFEAGNPTSISSHLNGLLADAQRRSRARSSVMKASAGTLSWERSATVLLNEVFRHAPLSA